jgi:hypothetical protein
MAAMHAIRRLLHTLALAAAGLLSDAAASEVEAREPGVETEAGEREMGARAVAHSVAPHRSALVAPPDAGRLESLVDRLGESEPALAAVMLGTALCAARPIDRMPIVCDWATSSSLPRRRALARALAHPFMCPGVATAIEVLAQDDDAHVRSAAAHAALVRLGHDPERYGAVLDHIEHRNGRG